MFVALMRRDVLRFVSFDGCVFRVTGQLEPLEPANRSEKQCPGELVHVDVKTLGRIGRSGHGVNADRRTRSRGVGWEYVHICIAVDRPRFGGQRAVPRVRWSRFL